MQIIGTNKWRKVLSAYINVVTITDTSILNYDKFCGWLKTVDVESEFDISDEDYLDEVKVLVNGMLGPKARLFAGECSQPGYYTYAVMLISEYINQCDTTESVFNEEVGNDNMTILVPICKQCSIIEKLDT